MDIITDKNYKDFLHEIKSKVDSARLKVSYAANQEVIRLYWFIGKGILEKQEKHQWGEKFLDLLSSDMRREYPGAYGFSKRNLQYMRLFASVNPELTIAQQAVAQLPWNQNVLLLDKFKNKPEIIEWYSNKSLEHGWSKSTLLTQIESEVYERQAINENKTTNFLTRLPSPQSDLAQEIIKDPYRFNIVTGDNMVLEKEIEKGLIAHIKDFLIELGQGFAFVGSQVPIDVGKKEYKIDLLFWHLKLRAFVVIEIKARDFEPSFTGQLSHYLAAVDNQMRHPSDNKTIGILLCKSKEKIDVEYALQNIDAPIGVSQYILSKYLPKEFENILPTPEEIAEELSEDKEDENK